MSEVVDSDAMSVVRDFYAKLMDEATFAEALGLMDENIVVSSPPTLPWGGVYYGIDGFTTMVGGLLERVIPENGGAMEYIDGGDHVICRAKEGKFTGVASGESVRTAIVEMLEVKDGKIVAFDIYYKDPVVVTALAS